MDTPERKPPATSPPNKRPLDLSMLREMADKSKDLDDLRRLLREAGVK